MNIVELIKYFGETNPDYEGTLSWDLTAEEVQIILTALRVKKDIEI